MVGNDIVDLLLAKNQSNCKRKGYLDKIFTMSEQFYIQNSVNQENMIWELWSRKEAVYKIIIQKGGKKGYYPIKIECTEKETVHFENQIFYTKTYLNADFIYSEAVENKSDFEKINVLKDSTLLFKQKDIPYVKFDNKIHSVSKTHHGRFEKIIYLIK